MKFIVVAAAVPSSHPWYVAFDGMCTVCELNATYHTV